MDKEDEMEEGETGSREDRTRRKYRAIDDEIRRACNERERERERGCTLKIQGLTLGLSLEPSLVIQ